MKAYETLTDLQWDKLKDLFPAPVKRGRGKPHTAWRSVVNSILYVMLTNAKWGTWPKTEGFASKSAAHRWFLLWEKSGKLEKILAIVKEYNPDCEIASLERRYHVEEAQFEIPLQIPVASLEQAVLTGSN